MNDPYDVMVSGAYAGSIDVTAAAGDWLPVVKETPLPALRERIDSKWPGTVKDYRAGLGLWALYIGHPRPFVTLTSHGVLGEGERLYRYDNPMSAVAGFLVAFEEYAEGKTLLIWRRNPVISQCIEGRTLYSVLAQLCAM